VTAELPSAGHEAAPPWCSRSYRRHVLDLALEADDAVTALALNPAALDDVAGQDVVIATLGAGRRE
jgi:hypothetical protein